MDHARHESMWILLEVSGLATDERAERNEAIPRIADERELEISIKRFSAKHRTDLFDTEMAMADRVELGLRERALLEQPNLFLVTVIQVRTQRLANGMRSSLGHGEENELVFVRNDHAVFRIRAFVIIACSKRIDGTAGIRWQVADRIDPSNAGNKR